MHVNKRTAARNRQSDYQDQTQQHSEIRRLINLPVFINCFDFYLHSRAWVLSASCRESIDDNVHCILCARALPSCFQSVDYRYVRGENSTSFLYYQASIRLKYFDTFFVICIKLFTSAFILWCRQCRENVIYQNATKFQCVQRLRSRFQYEGKNNAFIKSSSVVAYMSVMHIGLLTRIRLHCKSLHALCNKLHRCQMSKWDATKYACATTNYMIGLNIFMIDPACMLTRKSYACDHCNPYASCHCD